MRKHDKAAGSEAAGYVPLKVNLDITAKEAVIF
jgi:hypothetical protein